METIAETKNTYKKYYANVWVAQCPEEHNKGDVITLTTKHGKENKHIVHNLVGKRDGYFYYSITREDGFNAQERARRKREKIESWQANAKKRSDQYYEKSKKDSEFLSLGEPIKIGHHSEKRHRRIIEQAQNNARKWIEEGDKAESYNNRIEYWSELENEVNLSMPESIEFYAEKSKADREYHKFLKDNPEARRHSFALTYANNAAKESEKRYKLALKLWGEL